MAIYRRGAMSEEGEILADMIKNESKPSAEFRQKLDKSHLERDSKQVKRRRLERVTL